MQLIGPGHFADTATLFDARGTWTVTLRARIPGSAPAEADIRVRIR